MTEGTKVRWITTNRLMVWMLNKVRSPLRCTVS